MSQIDYTETIPNNVDLASDRRLQRALEHWQPRFLDWWRETGPSDFNANEVYLRTAVSVEPGGWAHFDYVRMPDYRWGVFLEPAVADRRIGFGDHLGAPAWHEVPGEYRSSLRRLIVTQGDTEPASVEQQRLLGHSAPSLYDLRNLFQVNVEEGRHLWAMVYLLHRYFGKDGRDEAEDLLNRRSGSVDNPRILTTFNEPCEDWLSFFCFTMFTDRDGKFQLLALAESGFDPLSRTTRFMLTEEAHHMFVGQTGVARVIERTCQVLNETHGADVRAQGAIPLDIVQRYINFWVSSTNDLFGSETSSNAANFFGAGLKGRAFEGKFEDHSAVEGAYTLERAGDGRLVRDEVPLRNAMNEVLRDAFLEESEKGVRFWNRVCESHGIDFRFRLPSRRFNRRLGMHAGQHFDIDGHRIDAATFAAMAPEWLPTRADRAYVKSLMVPCYERGKMAGWIAPPTRGIDGRPADYEYVRL